MDPAQPMPCCCATLPDLAVVPMGGDGLDERVFFTLDTLREHSKELWWLYLSMCSACSQHWLIAQEERIFDDYFLQRLSVIDAERTAIGVWPVTFATYERVLRIGHAFSKSCVFFDPLAACLVWTVDDLRKERADMTVEDVAFLLGVTQENAARLMEAKGS